MTCMGPSRILALLAVLALAAGVAATSTTASATTDPVVLTGTVRSPTGAPLAGIAVDCFLDTRPGPYVIRSTNASGRYSFRRSDIVNAAGDEQVSGCAWLGYIDPQGRRVTMYADGLTEITAAKYVELPLSGGAAVVKNARLPLAGTLSGQVTDSRHRSLFGVTAILYRASDKHWLRSADVSASGVFRFLGLAPGRYKVKLSSTYDDVLRGYRSVYTNGSGAWKGASSLLVRVRRETALGRVVMPNTKPFFASAAAPRLVNGSKLTPSTVPQTTPGASLPATSDVTLALVSPSTDPVTGAVLPADHPWARAYSDEVYLGEWNEGRTMLDLMSYVGWHPGTVVGRQFVLVAVHNAAGRASVVRVSATTPRARADS